ncbi:SusC/RagA family TonB-linked outer membrane protein [Mucilaginibacter boryungensis]|uniref:SusC/RagA family TonB-linked outer membrane protein n=1 Tax=Mucilaginibacter boryungensis TaxID=768480 RepID=A0ABR9XF71_9SPHI|nr:SusC/RagA family TonB-linked outer membrane protein [Mucilaginibacter boryungensis]MBE9665725.1 SusC/RagA family TonB-linked outer membrane protein [Mucilaginibacter boryungensis]
MLKSALLSLLVYQSLGAFAAPPGKNPNALKRRSHVIDAVYTGTLLDDQNNPLDGATVNLIGTRVETKSDRSGKFVLTANEGDSITISLKGFKTLKYAIGTDKLFTLTLEPDNSSSLIPRSAVVQEAYNTVPQNLAIASTDAVYNKDIVKSPVTSFRNALSGRLAGLYTLQSSGLAGSDGASLTLRGQSPIIIIDGVVANITAFDLEEIESVTVLKDALATAMLGVRGSHGAILVTTKKGSAKKQQISFTAQTAVQQPISWPKPLNAFNYATLRNEAMRNDGIPQSSGLYYPQAALDAYKNGSDPINFPNVNYRDAILKNSSLFNRYTLSASGGNRSARYFVSMEQINQSGFFKTVDSNSYNTNNNFKSYIVRSNVDLNITNKLSGGIYLLGRIQNSNEPGVTTGTIISNLLNTPANAYPLLNANNSFAGTQLYQNNLLAQTIGSGYRQRYYRDVLVNVYLKQSLDDFVKGLWMQAKVAYNSTLAEDIVRNKSFAVFQQTAPATYAQFGTNGTQANGNSIAYQGRMDYEEFSIGYDKTFGKNGLNILMMGNRDNSTDANDAQALPYTITGISGRAAYNYDGKYMAEATFGFNGSNRYPPDGNTKRGFFPAVGLGWNIEKEDFMKSVSAINRLKLYTSYGQSGWDNPGYFIYYPRFFDGPSPYFGTGAGTVTSITEGTLPNGNITFEKANKFNVGINGAVLDNKLAFTVEYFNNKYYDLVMQRGNNSTLIGNDYPNENIGQNKYFGFEGQLAWQQNLKNKFQYFISVNASSVGSKVLYISEVNQPYAYMYRTGQPVGQQFGYVAQGLFQSQAEINSSPTTVGYKPQPGDIKYQDLNNDGVINQNDVTAIGSSKPLFFYGASLGAGWHGLDISVLFQGVKNRNVYLSGGSYWAFQNNGTGPAYEQNLNRWTPQTAATATYPRLSYGVNSNNDAASSYWVRSGDYFRLKNAEIGYTLPTTWISKLGLTTVRLFANGYNLFTSSSSQLDGLSPETYTGGYPVLRLYNFGVNVKF